MTSLHTKFNDELAFTGYRHKHKHIPRVNTPTILILSSLRMNKIVRSSRPYGYAYLPTPSEISVRSSYAFMLILVLVLILVLIPSKSQPLHNSSSGLCVWSLTVLSI